MKARKPGKLEKDEHAFHLAIVEQQLGAFRDLVTALARRYPSREEPLAGLVEASLQHVFQTLRLTERRCLALRKRARSRQA